jgi:hypothetical protein
VPQSLFAPLKKCDDLLFLCSDANLFHLARTRTEQLTHVSYLLVEESMKISALSTTARMEDRLQKSWAVTIIAAGTLKVCSLSVLGSMYLKKF